MSNYFHLLNAVLTVEFNPVTYNVNEEDQLVTLTIVLSNLAAEEVSVSIETNDGSALGIIRNP